MLRLIAYGLVRAVPRDDEARADVREFHGGIPLSSRDEFSAPHAAYRPVIRGGGVAGAALEAAREPDRARE